MISHGIIDSAKLSEKIEALIMYERAINVVSPVSSKFCTEKVSSIKQEILSQYTSSIFASVIGIDSNSNGRMRIEALIQNLDTYENELRRSLNYEVPNYQEADIAAVRVEEESFFSQKRLQDNLVILTSALGMIALGSLYVFFSGS
jgi:hypothetical protein